MVFLGDSITQGLTGHTQRWSASGGSRVFDQFHGGRRAVSLGLSGDRTEHVLFRVLDGSVDAFRPRTVVLQIGINNINAAGHTGEATYWGIVRIVQELERRFPSTKIILAPPFPSGKTPESRVRKETLDVGRRLTEHRFGQRVTIVDLADEFIDEHGTLRETMARDGIHITQSGQTAWMRALEPQ